MFDVGDLPLLTFGNCVLKTEVIKWPLKLYVRFLRFFSKSKNMTFYVFFELLHTFSRTLTSTASTLRKCPLGLVASLSDILKIFYATFGFHGLKLDNRHNTKTIESIRISKQLSIHDTYVYGPYCAISYSSAVSTSAVGWCVNLLPVRQAKCYLFFIVQCRRALSLPRDGVCGHARR